MINYSNKISKNYENDRPYKMKNNHPLREEEIENPPFLLVLLIWSNQTINLNQVGKCLMG